MPSKVKPEDYVWVITEGAGDDATFLGLEDEHGHQTIPVTADKEAAQGLMAQLPDTGDPRQVEAVHRRRLIQEGGAMGYTIILVDAEGRVVEELVAPS